MKYLILIHSNPESRALWESFSGAEQATGWAEYARLDKELTASGELIASEALAAPAQGRRVTVVDGRPMTTDGPFAEAKEHLAGFYLVECADADRVVEIAGRIPEAEYGLVEVRPVWDLPRP